METEEEAQKVPVCCPRVPRVGKIADEFLKESTLHGVKYLGAPNLHIIERVFWAVTVLTALGGSIYLVERVYSAYNQSPVIISFQPMETSVTRVPFPAITICNVDIIKDAPFYREGAAITQAIAHGGHVFADESLQIIVAKLEQINHYCSAAPSFRRTMNMTVHEPGLRVDEMTESVANLQGFFAMGINDSIQLELDKWKEKYRSKMTDFFNEASHDCDDMILKCMWARKLINCSDFFFNIKTQNGQCCVFNMMPEYLLRKMDKFDIRASKERDGLPTRAVDDWEKFSIDKMIRDSEDEEEIDYPKYQMAGGKPYGLSLLVNPELNLYSSCTTNDAWGLKMVGHNPLSFPSIVDYGNGISPGHEIFVDIEPQITISGGADLSLIPVHKRGCLLPTDSDAFLKKYNFYTSTNCMDECVAKFTQESCDCVRYYMPRNATQSLCGAKKFKCADEVLENITTSGKLDQCPKCWPSCTDIKYRMELSTFPLRQNATSYFYTDNAGVNLTATNYSILHLYIGSSSLYAKERKPLYTASDLLANAGGLLSLCLGFSIISAVEIIYYCTLRPLFQYILAKREEDEKEDDDEDDLYFGKLNRNAKIQSVVHVQTQKNKNLPEYYSWMRDRLDDQVVSKRIAVVVGQNQKQNEASDFQLFGSTQSPSRPYFS